MATKVVVSLPGGCTYDVRIGSGLLDTLGEHLAAAGIVAAQTKALVITDENVGPLYLARAKASLSAVGVRVSEITVPAGEDTKSVEVANEVWQAMAQLALGRDSVVVALGGGVVGDLAGFVASTYMRGIPVVQVPTTLLAMVDSSVGGKTAVNLPAGKNLVGTFHQPAYVCADTDTLVTLDDREWKCGCGEIAKCAVIDSDDFFFWLSGEAHALAARDGAVVSEAIARSVVFKANVVAQDTTEQAGVRECLNFGHTLGHAIEAEAGYGTFSHGAAVAEGVRFAAGMACDLAGARPDFAEAVGQLLDDLGLAPLAWQAPAADLLAAMKRDKKVRGGTVRFVLANDVGSWEVVPVDDQTILRELEAWRQTKSAASIER